MREMMDTLVFDRRGYPLDKQDMVPYSANGSSSGSSEEECVYHRDMEIMSGIATYSGAANIGDAAPFCEKDVLMGRGKRFRRHPGNVRYAELIKENRDSYFSANAPMDKRSIIEGIVSQVLEDGRFLKFDAIRGGWVPVTKSRALIKTAHAIQYRQRKTLDDAAALVSTSPSFENDKYPSLEEAPVLPTFVTPMKSHKPKPHERMMHPSNTVALRRVSFSSDGSGGQSPCTDRCLSYQHLHDRMAAFREMRQWQQSMRLQAYEASLARGGSFWLSQPPQAFPDNRVACKIDQRDIAFENGARMSPQAATSSPVTSDQQISNTITSSGESEHCTSLAMFRVTSIGSFVTVDEELDVSRTDMNW